MLTLAINTASSVNAVCLMDGVVILAEKAWHSHFDQSEKLIPVIEKLLRKTKKAFNDLKRIIVVRGHGSFSAVRAGVTVANTLAYALSISLFHIDTETFWTYRKPNKQATLLIHAGRNDVLINHKMIPIERVKHTGLFYGDITAAERTQLRGTWIDEKKLLTFGKTLLAIPYAKLKKGKIVIPFYLLPPNITKQRRRLRR